MKTRRTHTIQLLSAVLSLTACGGTKATTDTPSGSAGTTSNGGAASAGGNGSSNGGAESTGGVASSAGGSTGEAPTWYRDIAPLVTQHCQSCHTDGGIAPFSLQTYAQAKQMSPTFDGVLRSGTMPPFLAAETSDCKPRYGWKDDLRLSAAQIDLFKRWNDAGCPEGDAQSAATLPTPPELELKDATVTVKVPTPVTIEGPGDKFICFSLAPDLTDLQSTGAVATLLGDNVLLDGVQIHPGNSAIVHHVLVYTDETSQSAALAGDKGYYDCFGGPKLDAPNLVMAWAPGATPLNAPEGVAMVVPSKGRLVMQIHYHPAAAAQTDPGTSLQLRGYGTGIPTYVSTLALVGNLGSQNASGFGLQPDPDDRSKVEFRIPAGAQHHTETMRVQVPATTPDYRVWTVGSHMHYVGTDMRIGVTRPTPGTEPADECLLDTPKWDFDWQRGYRYDVPIDQAPLVKAGDVLNLRCTYDNSMQNAHVAEALTEQGLTAPRDVVLGEETLDEMCLGVFGVAQKVTDLLK